MSRINLNTRITLAQAAHGIATVGHQRTIILRGEPGIGKSWVLKTLGKQMPTHRTVYIDCQLLLDQGDFFYPHIEVTEGGGKVAKRVALEDFDFSDGTPLIVMLDEIGKSNKSVMNVLLTLMYDRRIGNNHLPEGSIVFGTTNLASEGVGDTMQMHVRNRMSVVTMRKPTAPEWVEWGSSVSMTLCQQLCLSIHPLNLPDSASTIRGAVAGWANAKPADQATAARTIRERGIFIGTGQVDRGGMEEISAAARGRRKACGNVRDGPKNQREKLRATR